MVESSGSPAWQVILLGGAVLFILLETWRGWKAGLVRSGLHLAAIGLSTFLGFHAAQLAAAPLGGFKEMSGILTGVVVGLAVTAIVFVVMWILSVVLFKKTEHQSSGIFRMLWGLGGAFFGLCLGLLIVWGGVSIVRGLGSFAQARAQAPAQHTASGAPVEQKSGFASSLVTMKDSLEMGPIGKAVSATDPLSPDVYEIINQVGAITSDPEVMMRFIEYPDIQKIINNPKIAELLSDPSIMKAGQSQNLIGLMSNPAILAAVQDPAFAEELKKVDLRAALKFALEKPNASPAPSVERP